MPFPEMSPIATPSLPSGHHHEVVVVAADRERRAAGARDFEPGNRRESFAGTAAAALRANLHLALPRSPGSAISVAISAVKRLFLERQAGLRRDGVEQPHVAAGERLLGLLGPRLMTPRIFWFADSGSTSSASSAERKSPVSR
jgi:hypothetical protein